MTAPTPTRSAYPRTVEDLIPHARGLVADLGSVPSRNKLMKTFKVGSDKANALLEALTITPPADSPNLAVDLAPDVPSEPPEPAVEMPPPSTDPASVASATPVHRRSPGRSSFSASPPSSRSGVVGSRWDR